MITNDAAGLLGLAVMAVVLSYGLIGLLNWKLKDRRILLDVPNERSSHEEPTPRGGGVVFGLITLAGVVAAHGILQEWPTTVAAAFVGGGAVIAVVGMLDDLRGLRASLRLSIQIVVAAALVMALLANPSEPGALREAGLPAWFVFCLGVFYLVGLINAYNFMDGIDGLAGLQAVIAGFGWAAIGWYAGLPTVMVIGALVGSSVLGFLGHNWSPARIFMGDAGSTFLGFTFGALTLIVGMKRFDLAMAGMLLVFPFILDTSSTFLARLLRREDVLRAHRQHLYQRLVTAGLPHNVVSLFYGLLASLGAAVAVVLVQSSTADSLLWTAVPIACISLLLTVAGTTGSLHSLLNRGGLSHRAFVRSLSRLESVDHLNRFGTWSIQAVVFALCGFAAFLLRFELSIPEFYVPHVLQSIVIWVVVKSIVFRLHGLDRGWWRLVSVHDFILLLAGNLTGSLCSVVFIVALGLPAFPRSVYLTDFLISLLATAGLRLSVRIASDLLLAAAAGGKQKRVLVYGSGRAGTVLLSEIRSNPELQYEVVGFLDDNELRQGSFLHGVRVLGRGEDLPGLVQKLNIEEVLLALPGIDAQRLAGIIRKSHEAGVRCRKIPPLNEILDDRNLISQIRDVNVEDLLGRSPVKLEVEEIHSKVSGKVVMVTGAAGSIGSELCRQLARFHPNRIVGLDVAETGLFHIAGEMAQSFPDVEFIPCVASVKSRHRLRQVFLEHAPEIVYHAAAYKHVHLMESHLVEAMETNVLGTYQLALCAAENGVTDFVMISSDKAVRPTNIMGATKRAAELVISSMSNWPTKFVSVRFGNVLGSNGSVVPLFKEQIARGGPVTVTDARMERFFMTIPEAAQLVLQASTMGRGGEIFILDMGQPMKIVDLARNLILLSGLQPDRDIKIEFVGARPGEKLTEELSTFEENTVPTRHPKVNIFQHSAVKPEALMWHLDAVQDLCESSNVPALLERLKRMVPEYHTSTYVEDRVSRMRRAAAGD
ncbi:MAG: polysaccharide biosynthesis protein [Bryobacterales bacterium]|nr:polysaccharide biosynthesis protein [Bryobacterales bacterium]